MSFDAWEASIRPSSDSLMHFGIPGMKHGRRRYQNEDGTWTNAGLEARRKREGFGERRKAKKEARKAARAERIEKRRANNVKYMSDEDLRKKIERLKLEKEYKDMKRSPLIDQGAKLVSKYLEYKNAQTQREIDLNKQKIEMARIKSETAKSKDRIKITSNEAKKARQEASKVKYDVKGGLKIARKKDLKQVKLDYKNSTIRGGIAKRINMMLTSGKKAEYEARRTAKAEIAVNEMKSNAARNLNNRKWEQKRADDAYRKKIEEKPLKAEKKREEQLRKKRNKERKRYEKELSRIKNM